MSLLEDIFLQDEAGEAQELERIIEGDEYDERPRALSSDDDNNSEKDDEAVEDKRRVDPTKAKVKRVIKNPRFVLNPARLTGPRGIQIIPEHFKDFKFKGKGHEKEDLDLVLKKLEHWAYRLYPKFQFEDCLKKIETLGKKRPVMVHLHKIRSNQFQSEDTVVQKDSSDDELPPPQEEDEFDKLLQQQIDLARATPAPGSVKKGGFETPSSVDKRSSLVMPKVTASPSISDEQKERMMRNRQLAEERRLARLKQDTANESVPLVDLTDKSSEVKVDSDKDDAKSGRKLNKPNIIDSSDDENDLPSANRTVNVNIHGDKNDVVDITGEDNLTHNLAEKNVGVLRNHDKNDAKCGKKLNKTNVIDSSDVENDLPSENRTTNVDVQVHKNDVVDITEEENVNCNLTEKNIDVIRNYDKINAKSSRKPNKFNVIDSSDDENDLPSGNRISTVDIHGDKNDVVDITEEENVTCNFTKENVDVIRNYDINDEKIYRNLNKSNVIGSSDEENDLPSVNEPVIVCDASNRSDVIDITGQENDKRTSHSRQLPTVDLVDPNSNEMQSKYNSDENQVTDITEQVQDKRSSFYEEVPTIDLVDKNTTAMDHNNIIDKNQVKEITKTKSKKHTDVDSKAPTVDLVGAANDVHTNNIINVPDTDDNNAVIDITREGKRKSTRFNDEEVTTDKVKTDDVTAKKSKKLSVLDSSDDESDLTVGNQSKHVNVHEIVDSDSNDANVYDLTTEDEIDKSASRNKGVSTNKQISKTPNHNQIVDITANEDSNVEEIQYNSNEKDKRLFKGNINSKIVTSIDGKDTTEFEVKDSKDVPMETNVNNTLENENNDISNKDKIDSIEIENAIGDLMDVDFSDDF